MYVERLYAVYVIHICACDEWYPRMLDSV